MLFAFRSTIDPYEELRLYFLPYAELWMAVQELRHGPASEAKIKKKVKEIWE